MMEIEKLNHREYTFESLDQGQMFVQHGAENDLPLIKIDGETAMYIGEWDHFTMDVMAKVHKVEGTLTWQTV